MEKEELCFCLEDENLYLEQVLVEQEGVPIFFLCKSSEQNYLALFCGNDRYVVTKVSNSDLQKLLHGEIPMRDVILGQEEFWDIVAGEKPQQDIVECLPISELEVEVLPEEGACFEALTKEMQDFVERHTPSAGGNLQGKLFNRTSNTRRCRGNL